jgi:hypothetical protein|tara:strand:- start:1688 stop:2593 length:906 start_codon:yes stop_codon:yes gene_type:complete
MATSGSTNFELDVSDYIEEAFERCGLEVRTGNDLKTAKRSLNLMLAEWANRGLNQWTVQQTSITAASGVTEYPAGTLTLIAASSSGFTVGETVTGATSGATATITSLPAASSDFLANTLVITIPVGTFVASETITGGTSSTSSTVSTVPSFDNVRSTIDILSLVVKRDDTDFAAERLSRDSYLNIPNKASTGRPSQFFIDRQITPTLKIWPAPENNTDVFVFNRLVRMDDSDAFTDNLDVPFRFYPCLAAGLAYYLAIKRAPDRITVLKTLYEEEMQRAITEDRDRASFNIVPSLSYTRFN